MRPLSTSQNTLLVFWSIASLVPLVIIFTQTLNNWYLGREREAWDWLLAKIAPTLTLMIGAVIKVRIDQNKPERYVDSFLYRFSLGVIGVYFIAIYAVILFGYKSPLTAMQLSSIPLTFLQGLLSTLLGVFFVSAKER